jgi:hypothetical protein
MGSDDGVLVHGMTTECARDGDSPTVSVWLARGDTQPMELGPKDEIALDFADLVAKARPWTPEQVEVLGETGERPSLSAKYLRTSGATRVYVPPRAAGPVRRVVIRLRGLSAQQPVKATIGVTLKIQGKVVQASVPIALAPEPPSITTFRARPSIAVIGRSVGFEVTCERAASWKIERVVGNTATVVASWTSGAEPPKASDRNDTQDFVTYRVTAKGTSAGEATASVPVKIVERSGWISAGRWWDPLQVAGLCVSPEGDAIYALVRSRDGASVWSSAEGFARWTELAPAPARMVTTAPGVCFRVGNDPKLVFAGGSKVDPRRTSSEVWILDIRTRQWDPAPDASPRRAGWEARMGHACVVARDADGAEKIWVIGGVDADGNALDDAHVSVDGVHWIAKEKVPRWGGRCMFGATVRNSEIWIGGGFVEPDGKAVDDMWRWDTTKPDGRPLVNEDGRKVTLTSGSDWDLSAFALATLDGDVYRAAVERKAAEGGYQVKFTRMQKDRSGYVVPAGGENPPWLGDTEFEEGRVEAVGFNGCVWLFAQSYVGEHAIASSGLYYYVPPQPGSVA